MDTITKTNNQVVNKLKASFSRLKEAWEDRCKLIKKHEKKMEKIQDDLFVLKEERENFELEIEGLRTTFENFCQQNNIDDVIGGGYLPLN